MDSWSGTAPHLEVNYGAFPNFQLYVIAPLAFVRPACRSTQYGYADTELGGKWRFIQETFWHPQVGTFPLLELPTGDRERGLGSGYAHVFLPLWLQKSIGPWTTYGGTDTGSIRARGTGTGGSLAGKCSASSSQT